MLWIPAAHATHASSTLATQNRQAHQHQLRSPSVPQTSEEANRTRVERSQC